MFQLFELSMNKPNFASRERLRNPAHNHSVVSSYPQIVRLIIQAKRKPLKYSVEAIIFAVISEPLELWNRAFENQKNFQNRLTKLIIP